MTSKFFYVSVASLFFAFRNECLKVAMDEIEQRS